MHPVPLSQHWCVAYDFTSDVFTVCELSDYVTRAQKAFLSAKWYRETILAIHPTRAGANDEVEVWKERRSAAPRSREALR